MAQGRLAKITDFGLAKVVQSVDLEIQGIERTSDTRQSLAGYGSMVGTPPYMAPEQWDGQAGDERTDIYAIGCVLYELLTGHCPYQANTLGELRRQHHEVKIPSLSEENDFFATLNPLLFHCLAKQAENRISTITELLEELTLLYQQQYEELPKVVSNVNEFTANDYNNRSLIYKGLQLYDKALADCTRAIKLEPQLAYAYSNRGLIYRNLHRFDEALRDCTRAIELAPQFAGVYINRGLIYATLQRYEEALCDYIRAIELAPKSVDAYLNRGNIYDDLQRHDEALRDYTKAIELAPGDTEAYYNRAVTYVALYRYDEALRDYSRVIEIHPQYAKAYVNRGALYCRLLRYDEALHDYILGIELDPQDSIAHLNAGVLHAHQGRLHDALLYLEKAAELGDPDGEEHAMRVRQKLGMSTALHDDPIQLAWKTFPAIGSLKAMQAAVARFPFMTDMNFINKIEQVVLQLPPTAQPFFAQKLAWLRQIVKEQQGKEDTQ